MPTVKVSVIIPTYADWQGLSKCLQALASQDLPTDDFEIIVANNNLSADVPSHVSLPTNASILHVPTPGSYAARNAAIDRAQCSIIAFTDADCVPSAVWLSEGIKALENNEIDLVAGGVRFTWKGPKPNPVELYDSIFNLQQAKFATKGTAATANLFVRRSVFEKFGTFDEGRFSGGDTAFTKRATSGGAKLVYCESASVGHPARSNLSAVIRKARRITGAGIMQKRQDGRKLIVPHFDKLLPPIKALSRIRRSGQAGLMSGLCVWLVNYLVQLVRLAEQVRLLIFKDGYERK